MSELLVPVKDKKAAILAINLKADAIYCSGIGFSARANASISFEDLEEIINYASLYQTKVYITLNTLIFENELTDLILYLNRLNKLNYHALIIQDLGVLQLLNESKFNKEIHASTQMNTHNYHQAMVLKNNNISRVVLARENSIEEIKEIKEKADIELEVFIHGALCTSFSGQCLISSYENNQSGNKGTCNQHCRFTYTSTLDKDNEKYLLSLKDLSIKEQLVDLRGFVDSYKIEGRLKSLNYIYSSILYYQSILNNNENIEMKNLLATSFNRQYTKGRLYHKNGNDLSNINRINNHGLLIGKVIETNQKYIIIKTDHSITRLDSLRFINNNYEDGIVVEKLEVINENLVKIYTNKKIKNNSEVYIVNTRKYDQEIERVSQTHYLRNKVDVVVIAHKECPMIMKVNDLVFTSDFIIETSINKPMSKEDILKQLSKTNNTSIEFNYIDVDIDKDIFISKSQLNEFRRSIVDRLECVKNIQTPEIKLDKFVNESKKFNGFEYDVKTIDQARALYDLGIQNINLNNIEIYDEIKDWFDEIRIILPRILKEKHIHKYEPYFKLPLMISELSILSILEDKKDIYTNYSLNITNHYGLKFLEQYNIKNVTLSYEMDPNNLISHKNMDTTVIGYGHVPLMVMEYCPLNKNKDNDCDKCRMCQNKQHYLMHQNKKYPLVYMGNDVLELYSELPINIINKIDKTKVSNIRISFTVEDYDTTYSIVSKIMNGQKLNIKHKNFKNIK